jgi:predicted Zn-dependent protease
MFEKAISLDVHDVRAYRNLFSLYTDYGYKASSSAGEDILKEGIVNNPDSYDMDILLARYYRAHGRTTESNAAYDAAISIANRLGNTKLVSDLTTEKNAK